MEPAHNLPHKYVRVRKNRHTYKKSLYKCSLPGCAHKLHADLAIGRKSLCNLCGEEFVMTKESVRLAMPHCDNCKKGANADNREKLLELLEKI